MRLRNNPEAKDRLEKSKYVIKDFPYKISSNTVVELGMGKGEMIIELAINNPDKVYIGVEKYATVAERVLRQIENQKIENLFIINKDVSSIDELLKGKTNVLWLTFSDPWPKARHEKRRLTYKGFLEKYKSILSNDGMIRFKTDNDKLFEYSVESFKENGFVLNNVTRDFHSEEFSKDNIQTGYEKKWSSKGEKINYLEAKTI